MSIALNSLDFGWIIPTIKKRNLMPTRLRRSREMSTQESRPTKYQQLHAKEFSHKKAQKHKK
jgi:hypothetical protein